MNFGDGCRRFDAFDAFDAFDTTEARVPVRTPQCRRIARGREIVRCRGKEKFGAPRRRSRRFRALTRTNRRAERRFTSQRR